MTNLIRTASAWLNGMIASHASESVTYARGAESLTVAASIGRTDFEEVGVDHMVTRVQSRDFLIEADSLIIDSETVKPQVGDLITETKGSTEIVYRVIDVPGEGPWRWSDAFRGMYRIHTTKVSES